MGSTDANAIKQPPGAAPGPLPDVSVLLPARNAEATVAIAVRSVLRSRDVALELVIVEHGSVDQTPAVLHRFAAQDPRIRLFHVPASRSFVAALELGRSQCLAPFIARMDADDVMHPDRLRHDVAHLRHRAGVSAVACRVKVIPRGRTTPGLRAYVAWQNSVLDASAHAREIWIEQPLCHPATTFRAEHLSSVGGYRDAGIPEDYDLYLRLVTAGFLLEKRVEVHHAWRQHRGTAIRWTRDDFAQLKAGSLVEHFGLRGRPVIVAGAGKEGGRIARALVRRGIQPTAFLDVAERRIGRIRHGAPVVSAAELRLLHARHPGAFVIGAVGTSGSRGVVRAQLAACGFVEGRDCIVVA